MLRPLLAAALVAAPLAAQAVSVAPGETVTAFTAADSALGGGLRLGDLVPGTESQTVIEEAFDLVVPGEGRPITLEGDVYAGVGARGFAARPADDPSAREGLALVLALEGEVRGGVLDGGASLDTGAGTFSYFGLTPGPLEVFAGAVGAANPLFSVARSADGTALTIVFEDLLDNRDAPELIILAQPDATQFAEGAGAVEVALTPQAFGSPVVLDLPAFDDPTPIPLPAGAPLLLAGLAAMRLARRR